jgi:hypothetical protein
MSGSGAANEAPGAEAPLGADQLLGLVYEELRKLAALVHEGIAGAAGRQVQGAHKKRLGFGLGFFHQQGKALRPL